MAENSPIALDESASVIVVYCTDHPWWRACRFFRDEAQDAACDHEEREHPMDNRHREARRQRKNYKPAPRVAPSPTSETYETA